MFFVGFYQQRRPRRVAEGRVSKLNIVTFICQTALYAFACININGPITSTFQSGYGAGSMRLYSKWAAAMDVCENATARDDGTNGELSISNYGYRYSYVPEGGYTSLMWSRLAAAFVEALIFSGCTILLSLINKVWYEVGTQSLRVRSVVLYQNATVTAHLLCAIFSVVWLVEADKYASFVMDYVSACSPDDYATMNSLAKSMPSIPLIIAIVIDAVAQFGFYVAAAFFGSRKCHLDYTLEGAADGAEGGPLVKRTHVRCAMLNNDEPLWRNPRRTDALTKSLREGKGLAASTSLAESRRITLGSTLVARQEQTRRRSSHYYAPDAFVGLATTAPTPQQRPQQQLQQQQQQQQALQAPAAQQQSLSHAALLPPAPHDQQASSAQLSPQSPQLFSPAPVMGLSQMPLMAFPAASVSAPHHPHIEPPSRSRSPGVVTFDAAAGGPGIDRYPQHTNARGLPPNRPPPIGTQTNAVSIGGAGGGGFGQGANFPMRRDRGQRRGTQSGLGSTTGYY